jgi:Cd2+/Zn2+-exporting ATPase
MAVGVGTLTAIPLRWSLGIVMGLGLLPLLRQAWSATLDGNPFSIQLLMCLAAVGATVVGAESEAAVVILLFLLGEVLEDVAARRAQLGIQKLVDLVPHDAQREQAGHLETVAVTTLVIGDVVVVGAGQRIPADGYVISGNSSVDESPLTGESLPKTKRPDAEVYAGSVNGEGVLRVRVAKDASDNAIARIARMIRDARLRKAPVQRFITRFAKVYTPAIVGVAGLVVLVPPLLFDAAWETWIYRASALLLIGCPCALVISTPASLASALSAGAGYGLLLKGGDVLEALASADTVAFDKTGTLTKGRPQVVNILLQGGQSEDVLIALAAGISAAGTHPVAQAVLSCVRERQIQPAEVTDIVAIPGQGVRGRYQGQELEFGAVRCDDPRVRAAEDDGCLVSELRLEASTVGYVVMRDAVREEASAGLAALSQLRMSTLMLTGDSKRNAARVASALSLDFYARLLPEDKMAHVQNLHNQGRRVVKVGDGINDAPALAEATVGIAFGGGTDVALETADAASIHNRVTDIAEMIWLARRTMQNIRQNITIALGLKALFLVTTVVGITGMWPAILADTGATVLVTANALRLLRHRPFLETS